MGLTNSTDGQNRRRLRVGRPACELRLSVRRKNGFATAVRFAYVLGQPAYGDKVLRGLRRKGGPCRNRVVGFRRAHAQFPASDRWVWLVPGSALSEFEAFGQFGGVGEPFVPVVGVAVDVGKSGEAG